MTAATVSTLRGFLESEDLEGFLQAFPRVAGQSSVELTTLTQRVLPGVLLELLTAERIAPQHLLALTELVRSGTLLLVNTRVIEEINHRLPAAWDAVHGTSFPAHLKLPTASSPVPLRPRPVHSGLERVLSGAISMERVVVASCFAIGNSEPSDALSFKKNLCQSSQEREFLKAVRQYFPSMWAYPNVAIGSFLDLDSFVARMSDKHRSLAKIATVDVLLCTDDEDPVAALELENGVPADAQVQENSRLKNELLNAAGLPLIRIRVDSARVVVAEDFYDLLCSQESRLSRLRPRRLRPRREHDMLVPAESFALRVSR